MELTNLELNNTIVRLRKVVAQAKYRVTSKMIRKIRGLKKKMASPKSTEDIKKRCGKKLERYLEDLQALKTLRPDDVSKFGLLNTKTLQELKISGKTPPSDRVLYKVGTSEVLVSAIEEFREKYPEWHREVPFILQRLGMQYKFRKGHKETSEIKKLLTKMKLDDGDNGEDAEEEKAESADGEAADEVPKPEGSLLAKVKSRRKEEKLAARKRLEAKLKKKSKSSPVDGPDEARKQKKAKLRQMKKERKERRSKSNTEETSTGSSPSEAKPVAIPEGRLGQMEIRRLRLDSADDGDTAVKSDGSQPPASSSRLQSKESSSTKDPFFMDADADEPAPDVKKPRSKGDVTGIDERREKRPAGRKVIEKERTGRPEHHSTKNGESPMKKDVKNETPAAERKRRHEEPTAAGKQESTDKESLHPSWEAKRKQKLLLQNMSTAAGKKIKFD